MHKQLSQAAADITASHAALLATAGAIIDDVSSKMQGTVDVFREATSAAAKALDDARQASLIEMNAHATDGAQRIADALRDHYAKAAHAGRSVEMAVEDLMEFVKNGRVRALPVATAMEVPAEVADFVEGARQDAAAQQEEPAQQEPATELPRFVKRSPVTVDEMNALRRSAA